MIVVITFIVLAFICWLIERFDADRRAGHLERVREQIEREMRQNR
jgi:hypothetical protein